MPELRYVVLAGDDRVLPAERLRISESSESEERGWVRERVYADENSLAPGSALRAALNNDRSLSDDIYGIGADYVWDAAFQQSVPLPELAVGRLVERPAEMSATIDAYLSGAGGIDIQRSLAAGYDFMADATDLGARYLEAAGVGQGLHLGSRTTDADWQATLGDWQAGGDAAPDLSIIGAHARHFHFDPPDPASASLMAEGIAAGTDPSPRLTIGLACHMGLNAPGEGHPRPRDFAEQLAARGEALIAGTGWVYGYPEALAYQEVLTTEITRALVEGEGAAVGDALLEAKQRYLLDHDIDHFHAKTLAGTVLYGLPMTRLRGLRSYESDIGLSAPLTETQRGGLSKSGRAWLRQNLHLEMDAGRRETVQTTTGGRYLQYAGEPPWAEAGLPVQPKIRLPLAALETAEGRIRPRGVLITGAVFDSQAPWTPHVARAASRPDVPGAGNPPAPLDAAAWFPSRLASLRAPVGAGLEGRLLLYPGQFQGSQASGRQRIYESIDVDLYYSEDADRTPPSIDRVTPPTKAGVSAEVSVQVGGAEVAEVLLSYTQGASRDRWTSVEATEVGGTWRASLPRLSLFFVQAVDAAGNVVLDDNAGRYHQSCPPPCSDLGAIYLPALNRTR